MKTVYLDYNATTPLDPEVIAVMTPYLQDHFGNPSSTHRYGTEARKAVEKAREQVAALLHASPAEIIFTSGGTESNNMAIKGIALAHAHRGRHIITSSIEHPATLEVCRYLEKQGFEISYIQPDEWGIIHPEALEQAIRPDTILISLMHANNEVGSIQPVEEAGKISEAHGIFFHSDAAQSAGKIPVDVSRMGVHLLSLAGHKLYGPKGIGALYIRTGTQLEKLIHGASHEQNLRAGTENVLEIVGLGKACEIALRDLEKNRKHLMEMTGRLREGISRKLPDARLNSKPGACLPNTLSISFRNQEAETILSGLPEIAASAGAACHAEEVSISHVLEAMQVPPDYARGTIRFSTGKHTSREEIDMAVAALSRLMEQLYGGVETGSPAVSHAAIELTAFTQGLGCACKLRPQALEKILEAFPPSKDPRVLVDQSSSDDASVIRLGPDLALVQTLDFFTPIVDEPYAFGAIAAANSLSDIYAMGATPLFALNMVGFPSSRLPMEVLAEILRGAADKCREAGIEILGGHTIDDNEPKFGLAVSGTVHPEKILRNRGARPGDLVMLSKPIGTGILSTAIKRKAATEEQTREVIAWMSALNRETAEAIKPFPVSACTDVTGFGLLGHLFELTRASEVEAEIWAGSVPWIEGVDLLARSGFIPGGSRNNLAYLSGKLDWDPAIQEYEKLMLCDAQTSGGLLFTIPVSGLDEINAALREKELNHIAVIGRISGTGAGSIHILKKRP